ncbi:anti-sigma factor domain-containing protein [Rhodococcus sp. NPDC059234]|uniref:anti-sigma factor n=1 Tax=Rhodococcus sp. NPDC059234 TaxID=3346781 RepID=UPI003672072E
MPDNHTGDEQELLDLAYPYALAAVSEAERSEIAGRLDRASPDTGRRFGRIVADVQETMALVGDQDALAPPPELRERVLLAVEALDQQPSDELARRRGQRRRRIRRAVLAVAAGVVIVVGAAVAIRQFEPSPSTPTVAEVLASPDTRTTTTDVAGGTVTLSVSEQSNALVVSMADVPTPPEGHVYQMWFVPESGAPRSAGTMSATTMPPPGGEVIPALDSATAVTVTVEPGTGSTLPTGTPVVTIPLT